MTIDEMEQGKRYKMPWWHSKGFVIRVGDDYYLQQEGKPIEKLNFNSAHNFKICTEYVEVPRDEIKENDATN